MSKQISPKLSPNKLGQIHPSQAGYHLLPTSLVTPERAAYKTIIQSIEGNRLITLRVETIISLQAFKNLLDRWLRRIYRGLYRKPPEHCGPDLKIGIFGFIEPSETRDGKWHAHLTVRVPDEYLRRFDYVAATRWRGFGKAYTFHLLNQESTDRDLARVGHYVTKFNRLEERWWGPDPADRGMSNTPRPTRHAPHQLSSITGPRPRFAMNPVLPSSPSDGSRPKRKKPAEPVLTSITQKKQKWVPILEARSYPDLKVCKSPVRSEGLLRLKSKAPAGSSEGPSTEEKGLPSR